MKVVKNLILVVEHLPKNFPSFPLSLIHRYPTTWAAKGTPQRKVTVLPSFGMTTWVARSAWRRVSTSAPRRRAVDS